VAARADAADRLRRQQVERARYEAELAQRRFLRVDPANRLVADVLEADWNDKLQALADAQAEADRHRQAEVSRAPGRRGGGAGAGGRLPAAVAGPADAPARAQAHGAAAGRGRHPAQ
jgi:hypothetical protein